MYIVSIHGLKYAEFVDYNNAIALRLTLFNDKTYNYKIGDITITETRKPPTPPRRLL